MAELPAFMKASRTRAASRVAVGDEQQPKRRAATKAEEVVEEAEALAGKGGGKGKDKGGSNNILHQLVIILARLSLSMSNDLRDVLGVLLVTFLVPIKFVLAEASLAAGLEYQESAKDLKDAKKGQAEAAEGGEMEVETVDLGPPHIFIAMAAIHKMLAALGDSPDKSLILRWWKDKVEGKEWRMWGTRSRSGGAGSLRRRRWSKA